MAKLTGKKKAEFLRRMALGRKRKSSKSQVSKRRKTAKVIKKRTTKRSNNMARKKRFSRRRATSGIKGAFRSGLLKNVMAGIGGGVLAGTVANMAFPQVAPIAKPVGAFLAGGATGAIASILIDGGLGTFSNLFGGNTQQVEMSV